MSCMLLAVGLIVPIVYLADQQAGEESEVLARIGQHTITVRDYLERIDLTPWPGKDHPSTLDSAKINALVSLVAEKLLSMQAIEQGVTTTEVTRQELKALERLLARDELYRMEVMNKITFTPEEVTIGLKRYASVVTLNSYSMVSERHARQLALALNSRNHSEMVSIPTKGIIFHDTIRVAFGDLLESNEREAFAIDSVNEARAVSTSEDRWAVLQLLAKSTNEAYARASVSERQAAVISKLKKRKEGELVSEYLRGLFSRRIEMDSTVFLVFADSLRSVMLLDSAGHREQGVYAIRADEVDTVKVRLKSFLTKSLITMGSYSVSLEEIIDELKYFSVQFRSLHRRQFLQTLNQNLQRIAEAGVVSREAMNRKINWRPGVRRELRMWGDALQADKLLKHMADSIGVAFDEEGTRMRDSLSRSIDQESKAADILNQYIANLAEKYGVEMDLKKLKEVHINPTNIITRRFIGFGGGMMGVPMMLRLWEWLKEWNALKAVPQ